MALIGGGFSNNVNKLFNDPELSDVAIVLDNDDGLDTTGATKTFHAHRVILATMSDYFRSMLFGSFVEATKKEIRLPGVPYSTFMKVMEFVYLGKTFPSSGTLEEVVEFYSLVRMLLMDSKMNSHFEKWMIRQIETNESLKNDLLKVFALAFEWDMLALKTKCNSNICEIANEYLAEGSFVELPLEAVQMMLGTSRISCTRDELKRAIQAWISHHESEIAADVAHELNRKVAKFGKLCHDFNVLSLCRKKNQQKPENVQSLPGRPEGMEAMLEIPYEHSYSSEMTILKCIALRGIKICLEANQQFGPKCGRIKSELELCFKIQWDYDNYQRNLTVPYDFTQHEQQSVTIFFPEIACCKETQVVFRFSWKGSGVQPLLHNYGYAKINRKIETISGFYVTHIIYLNQEYESDGRCPECPVPDDYDSYYSMSSYHDSIEEEMETEQSEDDDE
uniref:Kelch-like protein 26 n=2 Tax=Culex pipiens TaxID=7175 RepID=A0A8D8F137_CULPI